MSKNRNRGKRDHRRDDQKNREIPRDVKEFGRFIADSDKAAWEKYKKYVKKQSKKDYDWDDDYDVCDSKKEWKESFNNYLIDRLPMVIEFIIRNGHIKNDEIQEAKESCLANINDPKFIKFLDKMIDKGDDIDNIKLLPVIAKEIIERAEKENARRLSEDANAKTYDERDLANLCVNILGKKLKKLKKAGIDPNLAFDILCVIPNDDIMKYSTFYRVRMFYDTLYHHASREDIPFDEIMDKAIKENRYSQFIAYALIERKDKISKLNDSQMKLYSGITNWVFSTLESLNRDEIEAILKSYISARRKDDANGNDGPRRFVITSLIANDYPNITKVVTKLKSEANDADKYLS
jgi:hypothetical protein